MAHPPLPLDTITLGCLLGAFEVPEDPELGAGVLVTGALPELAPEPLVLPAVLVAAAGELRAPRDVGAARSPGRGTGVGNEATRIAVCAPGARGSAIGLSLCVGRVRCPASNAATNTPAAATPAASARWFTLGISCLRRSMSHMYRDVPADCRHAASGFAAAQARLYG